MASLQLIDLRLLKTFVAVADAGGLTSAQVQLHRSLTAISNDIQSLEVRLGSKLCKRGRGGFALTEFGRDVLAASRTLFSAVEDFQFNVRPVRGAIRGELRIGVNEGHIDDREFPLSLAIQRYRDRRHNFARISVVIRSHEQILEGLLNDELDIGFSFFRTKHEQIEKFPVHQELNLLYCARGHPLFAMRDDDIAEETLAEFPMVQRTPESEPHWPKVLLGIRAAALGRTPEARAYLILSGRYIGWLAQHHADKWVQRKLVRPIRPDCLRLVATMEAALKTSVNRPRHLELFVADMKWALENTAVIAAA